MLAVLFICLQSAQAQNATAQKNVQLRSQIKTTANTTLPFIRKGDAAIPLNDNTFYARTGSRAGGDLVGNTSYDLPTNGTPPNWLLVYPDGTASVAFTGSTETDADRDDRGTFYNHYDGTAWQETPSARVEDIRTGFPALINVGDHEMFFSHDGNNNIAVYENDAPGSDTWTENPNSILIHGTWPRAACAPGSDYIHLLVANDADENQNDFTLYYRSPDGGATWDIQEMRLPGIDTASGYNVMGADCYVIRAIGSDVYIVAGTSYNDLAVWKSTSNGDVGSWTRTRIIEWPLPNFDGNTISDITGDGIADTITTHDGAFTMAIDNDGMMHVWSGVTYILDVTAGDAAWTYFPGVAGMFYWNESFGADSVQYLDFPLVDWDGDGDPFLGIGANLPNYGVGFTSQPSATLDEATGNMYVMYTQPVEYTDYFGDPSQEDAESFRDIFGFFTTDNGASWSSPINISYLAESYYENIDPSTYWNTVDNKVHVVWMQDNDPGNSLDDEEPDPITTDNNIIYRAYDFSRFEPYDPAADFANVITASTVTFNNLSVDAGSYFWDFDDGGTSTQEDPVHIFTATGTYNVCLTALNKYGDDQICRATVITEVSAVADAQLENSIKLYPSPATDAVTIEYNAADGELLLEIYNIQGVLVDSYNINSKTTLDISGYAPGEYITKISSAHATAIKHLSVIN